ncbi:MAG: peptide deformylase [Pseudomonadota bacterium]
MTRLTLTTTPNPILKMKSSPVEKIDKELQSLLDDMLETMYYEDGAGIAAVQVGVLKRIFILDIDKREDKQLNNPIFFINPEITFLSEEESTYNEGCLSFPGARALIPRPAIVKVKYLDYDGNAKESEFDEFMARGILHENDHLNGITMPDHLSTMKKDVFLRQVNKYKRNHNIS